MTDFEYALRTVVVASGPHLQIAHAVAPGTLITLCGTMAVPEHGSRWDETDPGARCHQCARAVAAQALIPEAPIPEAPAAVAPLDPASSAPQPSLLRRVRAGWDRLGRRARTSIVAGVIVVVVAGVVLLSRGGGFTPDQNGAPYRNGFAYGHDLMSPSNDVPSSCTQATVDDPASSDGKNFIAGCEAGYAARTP